MYASFTENLSKGRTAEIRARAARWLVSYRGNEIVARLTNALADPEPAVRVAAAKSLLEHRDAPDHLDVVEALRVSSATGDGRSCARAVLAIWCAAPDVAYESLDRSILAAVGPELRQRVREAISDWLRADSGRRLVGDAPAIRDLARTLFGDPESKAKRLGVSLLSYFAELGDIELLAPALSDANTAVVDAAVRALSRLEPSEVAARLGADDLAALLDVSTTEDGALRSDIGPILRCRAIGRYQSPLVAVAAMGNERNALGGAADRLLRRIRQPSDLDVFADLSSPDGGARFLAVRVLSIVGSRVDPAQLDVAAALLTRTFDRSRDVRLAVVEGLRILAASEGIGPADPSTDERYEQLLGRREVFADDLADDDEFRALARAVAEGAVEDNARLLAGRATSCTGKPLRQASWLQIARALETVGAGPRMLRMLFRARQRAHVLSALRLARKVEARRAAGSRRRGESRSRLPTSAELQARLRDEICAEEAERWQDLWGCGYEGCDDCNPPPDSWRYLLGTPDPKALRLPRMRPATALQARIHQTLHACAIDRPYCSLGDRLSVEQTRRLWATVEHSARSPRRVELPGEYRESFPDLDDLELRAGDTIRRGEAAAILALRHLSGSSVSACTVDWSALTHWLLAGTGPNGSAPVEVVTLATLYFALAAPEEMRHALQSRLPEVWMPLLPLLALGPLAADPDRLRSLDRGFGSRLVLSCLQVRDSGRELPELARRFEEKQTDLLRSGAGSLAGLDYPEFSVVSRPEVRIVTDEQAESLREIAAILDDPGETLQRGSLATLLERLTMAGEPEPPEPLPSSVVSSLERYAVGHALLSEVVLREQRQQRPFPIRKRHVRKFWERLGDADDVPATFEAARECHGARPLLAGLASALLAHAAAARSENDLQVDAPVREVLIRCLRHAALLWSPNPERRERPTDPRELHDHLLATFHHRPLELAQSLGLHHNHGFPLLAGGRPTHLEQRFRSLSTGLAGGRTDLPPGQAERCFRFCVLAKRHALHRGDLGRDCSTGSVPLRALSPHHTFYVVLEGKKRLGYLTVFEAWAETETDRKPALCLETINVPSGALDTALPDILVILEAISRARGLGGRLVAVTDIGTWNYSNELLLEAYWRFRKGTPASLRPADPAQWRLHVWESREGGYYDPLAVRREHCFRLLAPSDPSVERIAPETEAEVGRILGLRTGTLVPTAWDTDGNMVGFVSGPLTDAGFEA